ncbi:barnase inhibitor [Pseudomonas frederiksbergensis]|uniref:barstar family protein n=1 Tax=Pseudomonas frederiksbergensis TaxID=104087 RepID=UPI00197F7D3F|nr:barstar family protein [Pseudomonas frederiksbergensis]MBN3862003.1 barnase inhibitor [Pseudomonas frederiksbergensis]
MIIELDGSTIRSEIEFHKQLASALKVSEFYGNNLNALWDLLSTNIERPIELIWKNSNNSKNSMGDTFVKIVNILDRVKAQDESFGWDEKFTYILE